MNSLSESNQKKETIVISIAAVVIALGYYSLYILLSTLNTPKFEDTMGGWIDLSWIVITGTWLAGANVKEKGYQQDSIRIFGIITFFAGILLFFTPLVATVLFASGRGT